jgi:hypothetical protein
MAKYSSCMSSILSRSSSALRGLQPRCSNLLTSLCWRLEAADSAAMVVLTHRRAALRILISRASSIYAATASIWLRTS